MPDQSSPDTAAIPPTDKSPGSRFSVFLPLFLLALCAAVVVWQAIGMDSSKVTRAGQDTQEVAVAVEVAPIERGLIREVRVLSGTLEASTRFDVAAKVGGLIREISVDLGDEVERGQVVAVLNDDEFVQAVAQAKAELAVRDAEVAQARAELDRVMHDYNRLSSLHERAAASDTEFSEVTAQRASQEAAVALAEARVRQAAATLELQNIRLAYTRVRASWERGPDRGTVAMRFEDAGDTVAAGGTVLAVVGLDPLTAVVSVTEGDYARLQVGQQASLMTDARPGETFEAEVVRIAPIFRESSRQARVELEVHNQQRLLRPGMFIRVRLVLREAKAETIVPAAAMVNRGGRSVVFTIDPTGNTVTERPVEVGIEQDGRVQIESPKLEGRVVVLGQHLLENGAAVTVTDLTGTDLP